jgi:protein SCO1/2
MPEGQKGSTASAPSGLFHTLVASLIFALLASVSAAHITRGFEAWTFEDRRWLSMNDGEMSAQLPTLLTSHGSTYDARTRQGDSGQVLLVDFIYTSCPTICQVLGGEFYRMQQHLKSSGADSGVGLLSISIDPRRDGPVQLARYANRHRSDGQTWLVGVPMVPAELTAVLQDLQVIAVDDGLGGFVHNGSIHLLDGHGRLMGLYAYDQWQEALDHAIQAARTHR